MLKRKFAAAAVTGLLVCVVPTSAHAGDRDADGDGIPTRWEKSHGMNPFKAVDALADFDRDGLKNLSEYRQHGLLRDEDTDNDGHDDGDEVKDGFRTTDIDDADTDDDGSEDGDEDADHDKVDNEDEDDASERCRFDDDDHDRDDVDTEDENELKLVAHDTDSDNDGTLDGDEDADEDGEANEDEDDLLDDSCSGDFDGDGKADEDDGDLLGSIHSYDSASGMLVVTSLAGYTISGVVTADTEIELEESESESEDESEFEEEGTTADLVPGAQVAELEFDDETGALEEVTIYQTVA